MYELVCKIEEQKTCQLLIAASINIFSKYNDAQFSTFSLSVFGTMTDLQRNFRCGRTVGGASIERKGNSTELSYCWCDSIDRCERGILKDKELLTRNYEVQ